VLGVLFGYSFAKRVTWLAHGILGLALGLAPLGAWLAVRGNVTQDAHLPVLLALAVLVWVAGFDLIYASQDADFDRSHALRSVPARFGVGAALRAARVLHVLFVLLLVGFGAAAGLGWPFHVAVIAVILLLGWQHSIVSPGDLSRADGAFFTMNGWVSVLLFLGVAFDLATRGGAP
jgi:4-hydroxybenzoate polyprenyltransferase